MSSAAQSHQFCKLHKPARCRHCESYVYFFGAQCEKCGLSSHHACLDSLRFGCGGSADVNGDDWRTDYLIQHVIKRCATEIDKRGLQVQGIYRSSEVKSKVERLCQEFEIKKGRVDLSELSPILITSALRFYLRQLSGPLLSFRLYPDFISVAKVAKESESKEHMVERLKALVAQLSAFNFQTCTMLMHHLFRVSEESESNLMTSFNLGVVFGPTLLRPSECEERQYAENYVEHIALRRDVIKVLIDKVTDIFGPEPEEEDEFNDETSREHPLVEDVRLDEAAAKWYVSTPSFERGKQEHKPIPGNDISTSLDRLDVHTSRENKDLGDLSVKWYASAPTDNPVKELDNGDQHAIAQVQEVSVNLPGGTYPADGENDRSEICAICKMGSHCENVTCQRM